MSKKERHHTIPATYLRGFTDENGKNWILDPNGKIYSSSPEKVLREKHFYTIKLPSKGGSLVIEDTLANIERAFARVRDKLEDGKSINEKEHATIAVFAGAMLNRTKPVREEMRKNFKDMHSKLVEWKKQFETMSEEQKRTAAAIPSSDGPSFTKEDVEEVIEEFDSFHSKSLISTLPEVSEIIFNMRWCFIYSDDVDFITSDNPAVILRPEAIKKYGPNTFGSMPGLRWEDAELTIPISSNIILLAGWRLNERTSYVNNFPPRAIENLRIRPLMVSDKVIATDERQLENIKTRYYLNNW